MRTKLIALAAVTGVFLAGSASADGLCHLKRPAVARVALLMLAKQPTLVQGVPAPRKPL
jgi:hypothetical protein